jgi:hypothetical protein
MKHLHKIAMSGALVLGVALATPASAQSFGFSYNGPGYSFGFGSGYSCNPYSRYYDPFRCGGRAFTDRYYTPYGYYGRPYYRSYDRFGRPYYYGRPYPWRG